MRLSAFVLSTSMLAFAPACASTSREAAFGTSGSAPQAHSPVSVAVESPDGVALPTFFHQGDTFVAGEDGARYDLRITNHTAGRVEVVLSVDGRDVISGELANFKKQRGYVLGPFESIRVDGFRQSLQHVAAFRFSGIEHSYSALRGTPQHVGVIGVAVFEERASRSRKNVAFAAGPAAPGPDAFPGSPSPQGTARAGGDARDDGAPRAAEAQAPAAEPAPVADADAGRSAPASKSAAEGFAPPPVPRNELGTEYGETQLSPVHEVEFKRKRPRKPDVVFAIYYDSLQGLAARGVPVGGAVQHHPDPFPHAIAR